MNSIPVVPGMSWAEIEDVTLALLKKVAPQCLEQPIPIPIEDIIQFDLHKIEANEDVRFQVVPQIGSVEGYVDWDVDDECYVVALTEQTFYAMLRGDGRARQSASHEVGHFQLHREIIRSIREADRGIGEMPVNAFYRGRSDVPPFRNPERQANVFGSRLLQPSNMATQLISQTSINPILVLSDTFLVTQSNARVRLRELGNPG